MLETPAPKVHTDQHRVNCSSFQTLFEKNLVRWFFFHELHAQTLGSAPRTEPMEISSIHLKYTTALPTPPAAKFEQLWMHVREKSSADTGAH